MSDDIANYAYLFACLDMLGATPFGLILTRLFAVWISVLSVPVISWPPTCYAGRKELALATLLLDGGKGGITVLMTSSLIQPEIGV